MITVTKQQMIDYCFAAESRLSSQQQWAALLNGAMGINLLRRLSTMTNRYTVIGYYPDNDQVFASDFLAADPDEAVEKCRGEIDAPLRVTAVLHGVCEVADDFNETVEIYPEEDDDDTIDS